MNYDDLNVDVIRLVGPEHVRMTLNVTSGRGANSLGELSVADWRKIVRTSKGVPHSPIRVVTYRVIVERVPYWVAMHFRTHHVGVQFYISSQRGESCRDDLPQGAPVDMVFDINAGALLTMARARFCLRAAEETRHVMGEIRNKIIEYGDWFDLVVAEYMGSQCLWGECFEPQSCKAVDNP